MGTTGRNASRIGRACCVGRAILLLRIRVNMRVRRGWRVLVILVAVLSVAQPAYAYLDPGTGSMLLSSVTGWVAGIGLALKMYWYRVTGRVRGRGAEPGRERASRSDE